MSPDTSPPATKNDISLIMGEIGRLYDANERWKNDMINTVEKRILASEERTKRYFDVRVEDIRHDLLGVNKDRIENHEDRLHRLERHTGVA